MGKSLFVRVTSCFAAPQRQLAFKVLVSADILDVYGRESSEEMEECAGGSQGAIGEDVLYQYLGSSCQNNVTQQLHRGEDITPRYFPGPFIHFN